MEADSDRLARAGALLSWEGASARLAGDLERAVGARQRWRDEFESYSQLAEDIEDLQKGGGQEVLRRVNIGAGISMQAQIADASRIYTSIGLGFHLECTLPEALHIACSRSEEASEKMAESDEDIRKITRHRDLMRKGLEALLVTGMEEPLFAEDYADTSQ